jgi:hypothetical protein
VEVKKLVTLGDRVVLVRDGSRTGGLLTNFRHQVFEDLLENLLWEVGEPFRGTHRCLRAGGMEWGGMEWMIGA